MIAIPKAFDYANFTNNRAQGRSPCCQDLDLQKELNGSKEDVIMGIIAVALRLLRHDKALLKLAMCGCFLSSINLSIAKSIRYRGSLNGTHIPYEVQ